MTRRSLSFFVAALLLAASSAVLSQSTPAPAKPAEPFLPETFAGWQSSAPQVSADASKADAPNADVLKEYGFTELESVHYTRDGNKLAIRALRFADATGAYGAYTFYRRAGMLPMTLGTEGSFDGNSRILFWQAGVLCDAIFDKITAMSASDLREFAEQLPKLNGGAGTPPNLPGYLPKAGLDADQTRYAIGPVAYARANGVLPPSIVDFARGAEAITAHYSRATGEGSLTIINYPTPQIAIDRLKAIAEYLQKHDASAPQALVESSESSIQTRRSGPLVIVVTGNFTADHAKALAGLVHYDADVTWNNPKGYVSEASKAAKLLLGIATLTVVLLGVTILIGFFFGGGRIFIRKLRGKPATTLEEVEFIKLNLK
jgi:hypothetical protein